MRNGTLIEERPMERESRVEYVGPEEWVGIHHATASFVFVSQWLTRVLLFSLFLSVSLGVFTKLRKVIVCFMISTHPRGKTRLPLKGFSRNFILEGLTTFIEKIKIGKILWILYLTTYVNLWPLWVLILTLLLATIT
jgi:hypothetical protein